MDEGVSELAITKVLPLSPDELGSFKMCRPTPRPAAITTITIMIATMYTGLLTIGDAHERTCSSIFFDRC